LQAGSQQQPRGTEGKDPRRVEGVAELGAEHHEEGHEAAEDLLGIVSAAQDGAAGREETHARLEDHEAGEEEGEVTSELHVYGSQGKRREGVYEAGTEHGRRRDE
jgi:hypothetical protein